MFGLEREPIAISLAVQRLNVLDGVDVSDDLDVLAGLDVRI